ncbi:hypothetical protein [Bacillus sp. V3-13]
MDNTLRTGIWNVIYINFLETLKKGGSRGFESGLHNQR